MKLDWHKLSAVSQIVGTLAIVLTLIFLAMQTRQQTQAIVANTRQGALEAEMNLLFTMLEKPQLWPAAGLPSRPDYSDGYLKEQLIFHVGMFRSRENLWLQYRSGALDKDTWESYRTVLLDNLSGDGNPFMPESWNLVSPGLNQEFVEEINRYLQP